MNAALSASVPFQGYPSTPQAGFVAQRGSQDASNGDGEPA